MSKLIGWFAYETIGIGIPNPRPVVKMPIPEGLTDEQLADIERAIDEINASLCPVCGKPAQYLWMDGHGCEHCTRCILADPVHGECAECDHCIHVENCDLCRSSV